MAPKALFIPVAGLIIVSFAFVVLTSGILTPVQDGSHAQNTFGDGTTVDSTDGPNPDASQQDISVDRAVSSDEPDNLATDTNLSIFIDSQQTTKCTNIEWGSLHPNSNATKTIYIKNIANKPETLSMTTSDWNPQSASSILTLTWNREGTVLAPNETVAATLTLHAAEETGSLANFSFNIKISSSG